MNDDEKAAEVLRVLHAAEDPSKWGGVQIGQRWTPRGGSRHVYITDLVQMPGGKFVTYADATGKKIGSLVLSLFLTKYKR